MNKEYRKKNIIEKSINFIGENAPLVLFSILGTILVSLTWAVLYYFKELFVTYLQKDDRLQRGYYYKYIQLKQHVKNILCMAFVLCIFWAGFFFLLKEWRYFAFAQGFSIFTIVYGTYLVYYYIIQKNEFDLLDDFKLIYSEIKKGKVKEKVKKE